MDQQSMNMLTLLEALSVCECSFDANRMANMIQYIMQSNQTLSARIPASWGFSAQRCPQPESQAEARCLSLVSNCLDRV
jgi:hypothetical protein